MRLFHVSDVPNIERFDPRPSPNNLCVTTNAVWAVDEGHLCNYLLPRDCPRVTFTGKTNSSHEDVERFMGHSTASRVIAVEWSWWEKIKAAMLYLYEFPSESFELQDENAGYWISLSSCKPVAATAIDDLLQELARRNIELRLMNDLWPLHDAVAGSTLEFSMIRMRNASAGIGLERSAG